MLGLGSVGALVSGALAAVLATVVGVISGDVSFEVIYAMFLAGAGIGFVVTSAFGVVLAITSGGRKLEELSFWWATIVSGALGASLPLLALGGDAGTPLIAIFGLLGGFLGGGLVAVGKRARLRELEAGDRAGKLDGK